MRDAASDVPALPTRRIDRVIAEYGEIHRSLANRVLQAVALPLIVWSVIALLASIPFPASWRLIPGFDWASGAAMLVVVAYMGLSWPMALGLGVFSLLSIAIAGAYSRWGELPIWQLAITTLLIGWALHVLGRKLEGRAFAPLEDLRSLLIGPAWLLSHLYRAIGLRY
jgi:uncharacterized membrane protein YGL010W